jgi:probable selenium-dependent hydroxylase accessory protein YqeC
LELGPRGSLIESLSLREREVIGLVGAGGKTTLMFRLAEELLGRKKTVVTTTTTKILEPTRSETPCLYVDSDEGKLKDFVEMEIDRCRHITVARERMGMGKLVGVSPELVIDLSGIKRIDYIVVEADGAAGRTVKAPREREPVIPWNTTVVVALAGIDAVGKRLTEENVFQPERISRLTGIGSGEALTEEGLTVLMTHPEGVWKGTPAHSRVVVFLNKVDLPGGREKAGRVAREILKGSKGRIERIVLGQLKREPPVIGAMTAEGPEAGLRAEG